MNSPVATPTAFRTVVALLLSILVSTTAWSQLTMTQVAFSGGSALDVSNYPTVRVQVRILSAGAPIELQPAEISIVETNVSYNPASVTYSGNGMHVIQWTPIRFGFLQCTIFAGHDGETVSTSVSANVGKSKGAQVVVRDSMSRPVPHFVDFGQVLPGSTDTLKLKIAATEAALAGDPAQERPILIESVTTTRPEFQVTWKGSFSSGSLPTNIISPLEYRIDLVCKPTSNAPLYDVLTVTFEGGMRTTVMIIANPPSYPRRTILAITAPNGGELLAPCQEVPIQWTGMVKGFKAHLEYSTNNGASWKAIDSTKDSTFTWRVPESYSDSVRVRVYQKFEASNNVWLNGPRASVTNISYNADGRYLAAAYNNGDIIEWDVLSASKLNTYTASNLAGAQITALCYVGTSRSIIAAIARPNAKGGTLERFEIGTTGPTTTGSIPKDMIIEGIACNNGGSTLFLLPKFNARIPQYNPETLVQRSTIVLPGTAGSTTMNGPVIAASLLNGEVVMYSSLTGAEIDRSQTGLADALGPYAYHMATSLSGRLVAIAGPSLVGVANGPQEQRTFIYDMVNDQMVKILYREGSNAVNLGFSPSDAFLGLGFAFNPQFVVYDLVNAKSLPPTGSSAGHLGQLSDIKFGPDAATVATSSLDSSDNLLLRRVSVPESDMSDGVFSISPVSLSITPIQLHGLLLATAMDTTVTANVCNTGHVVAVFTNAEIMSGRWVSISKPIAGDSVLPGACLQFKLHASVLDTGLLTDTIELYSCGVRFLVPISVYVTDRNLQVLTAIEDLGDVCAGDYRAKSFTVLRNNDSIPVLISNVYVEGGLGSQFRIAHAINDTTLAPGQTLDIQIEFRPTRLGLDTGTVIIRYENQDGVQRRILVTGRGSGADLLISHQVLPFIPEIPERVITITNNSNNEVRITAASITAGEPFNVKTPMPQTLQPGQTLDVHVEYLGGTVGQNVMLEFAAEPCASQTKAQLTLYHGTATIAAPTVTADPKSDTTSIPITLVMTESAPYNGVRPLDGVLRVHPRLYLAREIVTTIGTATIVSQHIVNGWREIAFHIDGAFTPNMEVARLVGYAGMAEVDTSLLTFDTVAAGFGSSVQTTYAPGLLTIIYPDPNRRIIDSAPPFAIRGLAPMPANESTVLTAEVVESMPCQLRVVDAQGVVVWTTSVTPTVGAWQYALPVGHLLPGTYMIELMGATHADRAPIVVIR